MSTWPWLLLATCWTADPLYDVRPEHPWNEIREVFYTHKFTNGAVYEHHSALEPPWTTWVPFYYDDKLHERVIAILDRFLEEPPEQVKQQSPVRRAVMLRDLWPVFDAQTIERPALAGTTRERQAELRRRLARVMCRLELSEEELNRLPDNYRQACDQHLFPTTFDPMSPESPFLPPDLFDAEGPWVPFGFPKGEIGALQHVRSTNYRSLFVPLIRLPGGRTETLSFLELSSRRQGHVAPPGGTMLALVRRTVLPLTTGTCAPTALTESVQLMVTGDGAADRRFKFLLDRRDLLAGGSGLRALTPEDPLDDYGFESGGLHAMRPEKDADGEFYPLGRRADKFGRTASLQHCSGCHGSRVGSRLFANTARPPGRAEATTFALQFGLIFSEKERDASWKTYQALRNRIRPYDGKTMPSD